MVGFAEGIDPTHHSSQTILPFPRARLHRDYNTPIVREYRYTGASVPGCNSYTEAQLDSDQLSPGNIRVPLRIPRDTVDHAIVVIECPCKPSTPHNNTKAIS